jgi:hypothetical protein
MTITMSNGFAFAQPVDNAIVSGDRIEQRRADTVVQHIKQPPKLDGRLSDAVWRNAQWMTIDGVGGDDSTRTMYACLSTVDALYIAVRCFEPDMQQLDDDTTQRDALFDYSKSDDWVEVLIDPACSGFDYYWLIANARGSRTDLVGWSMGCCCQS